MDLQLTGKRALVTGGRLGIGKAIARQLAREGVVVAIAARDGAATEAAAAELSAETGGEVVAFTADTGDDASVKALVAGVVERLGGLDILVNSAAKAAGGAPPPRLAEVSDDNFYADMNVKVLGYLRVAREAAPHMIAAGWGRIINISGLAARQSGSIIGSMRNVAVSAMTKNLAEELGPHGITVTVVHPGMTRTERIPAMVAALAQRQGISEAEAERRIGGNNLIGRMVDAEEVADIVAFLASPRSVAINGDAIAAGGGVRGAIHY
jgi:NAD(P)-dependent dehydrogenase (short-subunit alcohol dehydrogenase family)